MPRELIVYGLPKGETERYKEAILSTQCQSAADVERIKQAAAKDGWHSFRVAEWNGEAPDFAAAVTEKRRA